LTMSHHILLPLTVFHPHAYHPHLLSFPTRRSSDLQTLMLLGFGTTGRDLTASFEISSVRAEVVESQKATHLDLIPKSPELRHHVDRKSTRLNSSHVSISYAVFCLKKKKKMIKILK